MVVYVKTQGARILKEGRHLVVKKDNTVYHTLFTYKLKQLVIFGSVTVTPSAMAQLMKKQIDTVFLTYSGRYLGRIAPLESKNVFLHKRQYILLDDPMFALRFVRSIIYGKLSNMATLLMRIKRSRGDKFVGVKANEIRSLIPKLNKTDSIDSLRGYEGRASAIYFSVFNRGFIDDMGFSKRIRRPPTDPVNSILSLLYTFLLNRVYAAIRIAGLDPYPGFLHAIDYGRYSLVLDLMEEFRTIIADTLTLSLFNLQILKKNDFCTEVPIQDKTGEFEEIRVPDVSKDPIGLISDDDSDEFFDIPEQKIENAVTAVEQSTGKRLVRLTPEALKRVIEAFERKMTTEFYYPPSEQRLTYADAIIYQARHFRKVVEGETTEYQPVLFK